MSNTENDAIIRRHAIETGLYVQRYWNNLTERRVAAEAGSTTDTAPTMADWHSCADELRSGIAALERDAADATVLLTVLRSLLTDADGRYTIVGRTSNFPA